MEESLQMQRDLSGLGDNLGVAFTLRSPTKKTSLGTRRSYEQKSSLNQV